MRAAFAEGVAAHDDFDPNVISPATRGRHLFSKPFERPVAGERDSFICLLILFF